MKKWGTGTRAIHAGEGDAPWGAHTFPIFQTGTFYFKSFNEGVAKFTGREEGFVYTRIDNPNFRNVEKKIATLEKGEDALVFSSGMSAIFTTVANLASPEGLIIATQTLYGCTDELLANILPRFGIKVKFVDTRYSENVEKAIKAVIKREVKKIVVFLETPANPTLVLADIKEIAKIVKETRETHQIDINLVVDNSFASPYNQRPLELGADVVVNSTTKYINGHGDVIQGAAVGNKNFIREIEHSLWHWRGIIGVNPGPFDAWLVRRGLMTFHLRMKEHNTNAAKLAQFLEGHPEVKRVYYPGLASHPQHELAKKQMGPGFSGMISFELKGNQDKTKRFLETLTKKSLVVEDEFYNFIVLAVSLGYVETLIESPASMTHVLIPKKERLKKGITDTLIRLSVGIEDYEDIEEAFKKALDSLR